MTGWPIPATVPNDVELLLVTYLTPLLDPTHVGTDWTGYRDGDQWVTVNRTGGLALHAGRAEQARIDVQVLAGDKATAWGIASAVGFHIFNLPNATPLVLRVLQAAGWAHVPDADAITGLSRYSGGWYITVAGIPAAP
jgi:hypothetical protein